jgi:hypothetical protein
VAAASSRALVASASRGVVRTSTIYLTGWLTGSIERCTVNYPVGYY